MAEKATRDKAISGHFGVVGEKTGGYSPDKNDNVSCDQKMIDYRV